MPGFTQDDRGGSYMNLCSYGCGQEAKYQFKNGKLCCSDDCHRCIEFKKKYAGKNNPSYGISPSEETREKQSKKLKGKKRPLFSEEHKKNISISARKRKPVSMETRKKMSESRVDLSGKTYKEIYGEEKAKKIRYKIKINHADISGENNPNWKGGISCEPYCQVWADDEYKNSIKKRDNYVCQNCGITRLLSLKVYSINLHIHHIDYNKKNCKPNNLITVCRSCNSKANFDRVYWEKYYKYVIEENKNNDNF